MLASQCMSFTVCYHGIGDKARVFRARTLAGVCATWSGIYKKLKHLSNAPPKTNLSTQYLLDSILQHNHLVLSSSIAPIMSQSDVNTHKYPFHFDDPISISSYKILAHACSYDGLTSRLVEEAGFPMVFLAGYPCASSYGLPDTGYIAMEEMCNKIQEAVRQVNVPVMADGDTGYGSPMNVKRTVESYALAGAAGVMIEDQTWPKRSYLLYGW